MRIRIISIMLIVCMLISLAIGCAPNAEPSSSVTPTQTVPDGTPANETDPGTSEEDKYGGDLIVFVTRTPVSCFAPAYPNKTDVKAYEPAVEPLGKMDKEGNYYGFLVEEFIEDPEGPTLTIKLRDEIYFHDGSKLDAEALMWNLQVMKDTGSSSVLCDAVGWEAVDDLTVKVAFEYYSNNWIESYAGIHVYSMQAVLDNGEDWAATNAVGTGPFIQVEHLPGSSIKFERNENYWQEGLPYLDSITMVQSTDISTQLTAMVNGEAHVVNTSDNVLVNQLDSYGDMFKSVFEETPTLLGLFYIILNSYNEESPLYDVRVRQAMTYCLDRDSTRVALVGNTGTTLNQMAIPGSYAYLEEDELYDPYDYNPEKAKELLTEAGYPNGFDVKILSRATFEKMAVSYESFLKAVGINATIYNVDNATYSEKQKNNPDNDVDVTFIGSSPCTYNYVTFYNGLYHSEKRARYINIIGNFEELDTLLDKAVSATTQEELTEYLQAVNSFSSENALLIPWYSTGSMYYFPQNLYDTGLGDVHTYQSTYEIAYFAK